MNEPNCSLPVSSIEPESGRGAQANIAAPTEEIIGRAVKLLQAGEVIGLPTETVYGLAGDALNPAALARIFEVKRRPLFDPLIIHLAEPEAAFALATHVPEAARRLAAAFWPGPFTLILPKKSQVPDLATSGLPNVALRVPDHPVAQKLLRAFGGPLAAPSANRFGRISPTDARAVAAELGGEVSLILDGGACAVGLESTVLDFSGPQPRLLRSGGIALNEIEKLIGAVERATPVDERPAGPGQLKHHYAPRKKLFLAARVEEIPDRPEIGRLVFGADGSFTGTTQNLSPTGNLREAAANFFRGLRALDDDPRVEIIYAAPLPSEGLGLAMTERLERASAPAPASS